MPDNPSSIVARARFLLPVEPEAGVPERIERHSLGARAFHWLMAIGAPQLPQ